MKIDTELTANEKRDDLLMQPHNLLCNSTVDRDKINGVSLPENSSSIEECKVEEWKAMIVCRGSRLIRKDGKALSRS